MPIARSLVLLAAPLLATGFALSAQQAAPRGALARMPVKEVSIFKDGHAFVLHEGAMATDASGNVVMDYLPAPVLGTFWAYTADPGIKVSATTAGQHRVVVERTALKLAEILESNIGEEVTITEEPSGTGREGLRYPATLLGIPRRSSEELEATSPPNTAERLPMKGELILLKTSDGVKALPLTRIQDVTFKTSPKSMIGEEEFRNLLTLQLNWANRGPQRNADVGIVYLQKGLRWIPSYRIELDGRGAAKAKLQAVLINDLTDLDGVTANLVIGVPSFAFKETLDPLALLQVSNQLSNYFQTSDRSALSNAIASQAVGGLAFGAGGAGAPAEAGPAVSDASQNEDLFLFTVKNISLKKGQRLSLPVGEQSMKYKDIYTLALSLSPPPEVRGNLPAEQQTEIARLLNAPRPAHKIRLTNSGAVPLTTAPALVLRDDRILSQGTMTYAAPGAMVDLEIGQGVDVQVTRTETETSRTANALRVNGDSYWQVNLTGSVKLTNFRKEIVEIEVTREMMGAATSATNNGQIQKLNALAEYPAWWRYYSWPYWWNQMNALGRITWNVTMNPGQSVDLHYDWQYYWR